jgi:hypothetical protein
VKNIGSSGKKKTTMAKLAREATLRERRLNKQAKKDARKHASSDHFDVTDARLGGVDGSVDPAGPPALPAAIQPPVTNAREDDPNETTAGSAGQQSIRVAPVGRDDPPHDRDMSDPNEGPRSVPGPAKEAVRVPDGVDREQPDPREKEVALLRLRDASDEELAVFEGKLQANALEAGATEREMRDAQRNHPGRGA